MEFSLATAILALFISALTAWLTFFNRGVVKMTQPTTVYFGPARDGPLQVYLRTLLYATSKRGRIIESMFVRIRRGETAQNFNVWVYREDGALTRGSGLFIPDNGVVTNHHFLLPLDGTRFEFLAGTYVLEAFASVVGEKSARLLKSIRLTVSSDEASALLNPPMGLYFDWSPDAEDYQSHLKMPDREQ